MKKVRTLKKTYEKPLAEKLDFNYSENVVASSEDSPVIHHHGDNGHGNGCVIHGDMGGGNGCRRY